MTERNVYGRVYLFASAEQKYSARIWDQKGRDIWHVTAPTADLAYESMRAAALEMGSPVDLYRHGAGAEISETTLGKDLPF